MGMDQISIFFSKKKENNVLIFNQIKYEGLILYL